jgi:predicted DNA-binding transcriptional regulator AlpA
MFNELELSLKRIEEMLTVAISILSNNPAYNNGKTMRKILSRRELCDLLQISESSRVNYVRKGLIPEHRIGRRVFYFEDEVIESIQRKDKKKSR